MPPDNDQGLPAGAITPDQPAAIADAAPPPAAPAPTSLPIDDVIRLIQAQGQPAQQQQPVAPVVPVEVQNLNRFMSDPAWAAQAVAQMSNGRLNAEDPVHVAFVESELRRRAEAVTMRQELRAEIRREASQVRAEQAHQAVQGAFEAALDAHPGIVDEGLQTMLANEVGRLVYKERMTVAAAVKKAFAPVASLATKPVAQAPSQAKPVTSVQHALAAPNGGAGRNGAPVGGRAALQQAYADIKRLGVRRPGG